MRCAPWLLSLLALGFLGFASSARATDGSPRRADVERAIDRGLVYLTKEAQAWKSKYHCASCHHAALVVWSMRKAEERGRPVDAAMMAELTKWMATSGDGKTSVKRPSTAPRALDTKALYFALGLASDRKPDSVTSQGLKLLLETVKADQAADGSWVAWPETRPPFFGASNETMTALATLALLPGALAGDTADRAAMNRGVEWLANTKTDDDPQSVALRLMIWRQVGRPAAECRPLVERIEHAQQPDGGWNQAKGMPSDAWATGQALYALSHAPFATSEAVLRRGSAFLVHTQASDGSWPMTSRPVKPGGPGSTSLIPITGAGTAWGVIGLARSR